MAISSAQAIYGLVFQGVPTSPLASGSVQVGTDQTRLPFLNADTGYAISALLTDATDTLTLNVETGSATGTSAVKASRTIGTSNAAVTYTAKSYGGSYEDVSITHATPASSTATSATISSRAITVTAGTKARVVITGVSSPTSANRTLFYAGDVGGYAEWTDTGSPTTYNAKLGYTGTVFQYLSAEGTDPPNYNAELTAAYSSFTSAITLTPSVGTGSATATFATSNANQVAAAVNANTSASALVVATAGGTGLSAVVTGSGSLTGAAGTYITGGGGSDWQGGDVPDISILYGIHIDVTSGSATASNGTHTFPLPVLIYSPSGLTGNIITNDLVVTATSADTTVTITVVGSDS